MTDKNVLDLKMKILAQKIKEGPSFVCCNECDSQEHGFAVRGRFNDQGAYFIESLLCLNPDCESETDIIGGFVV